MARRVQHAPHRGIVERLLRYRPEGGVVQGQHRVVYPGDVTKTPHVATVFWSNPLPGICGSLAVLAGPEAGLAAVWVFLRVA